MIYCVVPHHKIYQWFFVPQWQGMLWAWDVMRRVVQRGGDVVGIVLYIPVFFCTTKYYSSIVKVSLIREFHKIYPASNHNSGISLWNVMCEEHRGTLPRKMKQLRQKKTIYILVRKTKSFVHLNWCGRWNFPNHLHKVKANRHMWPLHMISHSAANQLATEIFMRRERRQLLARHIWEKIQHATRLPYQVLHSVHSQCFLFYFLKVNWPWNFISFENFVFWLQAIKKSLCKKCFYIQRNQILWFLKIQSIYFFKKKWIYFFLKIK